MAAASNEIQQTRLDLNLCQEWVANQLGILQPSYSKIETGRVKLKEDRAKQLSEILGIEIKPNKK